MPTTAELGLKQELPMQMTICGMWSIGLTFSSHETHEKTRKGEEEKRLLVVHLYSLCLPVFFVFFVSFVAIQKKRGNAPGLGVGRGRKRRP